jgi:hypothetical protein
MLPTKNYVDRPKTKSAAVLSISGKVYKRQEMEIDAALSEIESKYDFTFNMFKEKQLTAIKSIIENKIPLTNVYKHFLSSSSGN